MNSGMRDFIILLVTIIVTIMLLVFGTSDVKAQGAQFDSSSEDGQNNHGIIESTVIPLQKGWELRFDLIPFGSIVQVSNENNTQLEAKAFIGSGVGISFVKRNTFGLNVSILFYGGEKQSI